MLRHDWRTIADVLREELLRALDKSEFEFHLTGSRFFHDALITADIDLFAKESEEIKIFLSNLAFRPESLLKYNGNTTDINTAVVYRNLKARIDIQLIKNVDLKIEIHKHLTDNKITPPQVFDKQYIRKWWDELYCNYLFEKEKERGNKKL